jgi:hypothetical protein
MATVGGLPIPTLSVLQPALLLGLQAKVKRGIGVAAFGGPQMPELSLLRPALQLKQQPKVEGSVGAAGVDGPPIPALGLLQLTPPLEQHAEVACGVSVAASAACRKARSASSGRPWSSSSSPRLKAALALPPSTARR